MRKRRIFLFIICLLVMYYMYYTRIYQPILSNPLPTQSMQLWTHNNTNIETANLQNTGKIDTQINLHCRIACCGHGDRYQYQMLSLISALRNHSIQSITWDWGPCIPINSSNILDTIFPLFDTLHFGLQHKVMLKLKTQNNSILIPHAAQCVNNDLYNQMVYHRVNYLSNEIYFQLFSHFKQSIANNIQKTIDEFILKYKLIEIFTVGVHIRYGNPGNVSKNEIDSEFESKHRSEIMRSNFDVFFATHLKQIDKLMNVIHNGKNIKYQILFITDTKFVQDYIESYNIKDIKLIFRQQIFHEYAHPLVYMNLRYDNAGNKCDLNWFVQPIIDQILLSNVDILVSTSYSGFTIWPEIMLYNAFKYICYANNRWAYWTHNISFNGGDIFNMDPFEYLCLSKKFENKSIIISHNY
eukprot:402644_1